MEDGITTSKIRTVANQSLKEKEYWLKKLSGEGETAPLKSSFPYDHKAARREVETGMASLAFQLNRELVTRLLEASMEADQVLHIFLAAGLISLLGGYSYKKNPQVLVGTPVYKNPSHTGEELINTILVLKNRVEDRLTFKELFLQVRQTVIEAVKHQNYPVELLPELVGIPFSAREDFPLVDVVLLLENIHDKTFLNRIRHNVTFSFTRKAQEIHGVLEYNAALYQPETIKRIVSQFTKLLEKGVFSANTPLSQLDILSNEEKKQLLVEFNDTAADYPANKTIHQLFQEQVEKTPDNTAVVGPLQVKYRTYMTHMTYISYRELNKKSHQLAHLLKQKGAITDTIVGMMMERSVEMIIYILGILKAGGAYMPIDPEYPEERINYMLVDSNASILLTHKDISSSPSTLTSTCQVSSTNLAYIIYTSGTTGKPKGCLVEHRNVVRLLKNSKFQFGFHHRDVWTLFHSYCFDFSVWEMYGALLYGGKLILIPRLAARDPGLYLGVLKNQGVTILNQTPSAFYNLIAEELKQKKKQLILRYVIFGGEALQPGRLREWQQRYPHTRLVNMFGITETTVHVTFREIDETDIRFNISNIGKPIPTLSLFVLGEDLRLLPLGVPGELYVGGDGVARGYLNQPELTCEKFDRDLWDFQDYHDEKFLRGESRCFTGAVFSKSAPPGRRRQKIYKTGDLVRCWNNGEMEYLGRLDRQVQLRGFRVELAEIENQLLRHESVKDAVVVTRTHETNNDFLCAYIVNAPPGETDTNQLREYLSQRLPYYMVPSYLVMLDKIPLTPNGKVDVKALPGPQLEIHPDDKYIAPRTQMETQLVEIWQKQLAMERIGVKDNYFNIGGDSIKAIQLVNTINQELQVNITIPDLYQNETIEKITQWINRQGDLKVEGAGGEDILLTQAREEIEALNARVLREINQQYKTGSSQEHPIEEVYPMSDIEKGMVFVGSLHPGDAVYHDQMIYQVTYPDFNENRFRKALELMVEKHAILRVGFNMSDFEESLQFVYKRVSPDCLHDDISLLEKDQQETVLKKFLEEDRKHPFDLKGPLWRIRTFALGSERIVVVLICHHAILDGWSVASFSTELNNIYVALAGNSSFVPSKLKSNYKDFIVEQIAEKKRIGTRQFWIQELEDYKRLDITRFREPGPPSGSVEKLNAPVETAIVETINNRVREWNTSLKHLCFAAYVFTVSMLSWENDVVVGLSTNNRPLRQDSGKILGCFLNAIPVRIKIPSPNTCTWWEYFRQVEEKLLEIKYYDRLSLFEIARLMGEKADVRNPLFDIGFNFIDFHIYREANVEKNTGEQVRIQGYENNNIPLTLNVNTTFGGLGISFTYNSGMISRETVKKLYDYFFAVLAQLVNQTEELMDKHTIIPDQEKQKILFEFNRSPRDSDDVFEVHRRFEEMVREHLTDTAVSAIIPLTDIYDALASGSPTIAGYLWEKLGACCFKKNPYLYEADLHPGSAAGDFKIIKTHHHNSVIVPRVFLKLLNLFDGKKNLDNVVQSLQSFHVTFPVFSISSGDVLEIALDLDVHQSHELVLDGTFAAAARWVKWMYNYHLLELKKVDSRDSITNNRMEFPVTDLDVSLLPDYQLFPDKILRVDQPLSKARVLLLGDTPGMATTGLLYLASFLKRSGISVYCQFYDSWHRRDELKIHIRELLSQIQPDIVGVSMKWFLHIARVLEMCKIIKEHSPGVKVVIGGNTASYYPEEIIKSEFIDYLICGDAEIPFLELCRGNDYIQNCMYKDKTDGKIIKNPVTYVESESNQQEIYLSHLDETLLSRQASLFGSFFIYTHKGCLMNCLYCGGCREAHLKKFNRSTFYRRGTEEVRKDIIEVKPFTSTFFFDFDAPNPNLLGYCRKIWQDIDLSAHFCILGNLVPPSAPLIEYTQSTFKYVYWNLDIASLSERHRDQLFKAGKVKPQPTDEEIFAFFDECQKYENAEVRINLIAGLPYFTAEDIRASEQMLHRLMNRYTCLGELHWARLHAQPGAPVVENAGSYGMHSYAETYKDFLEYSQRNFHDRNPYPNVEYFDYPYIYYNDDSLNSKVSRHYQEMNTKVRRFKKDKQRQLVVSEDFSYEELNRKADQLAQVARTKGLRTGDIAALMLEAPLDIVVGIFGILKAGAAYLPIDPHYPSDRIDFMLKDSNAKILVTTPGLTEKYEKLSIVNCQLLMVNEKPTYSISNYQLTINNLQLEHANLAYIIYTSGTTGRPRGVLVEHTGIANYARWRLRAYRYTAKDVTLQLLSYSFDGYGSNFYSALLSGGTLVMVPGPARLDMDFIKQVIIRKGVTNTSLVPGMYEALLENVEKGDFPGMRFVVLAGETAKAHIVAQSKNKCPNTQLIQEYGPTETSVTAIANMTLETHNTSVIGKPIPNTCIYIFDICFTPVPIGVPGELFIAGTGVARGYLNRPDLTFEKFCLRRPGGTLFEKTAPPGPPRKNFSLKLKGAGKDVLQKLSIHRSYRSHMSYITHLSYFYKTGDLGRWQPEGNIEFLGRIDQQVKIRGFRIEPGEIEARLMAHPLVSEAVVLDRVDETGARYLCAYVVPDYPGAVSPGDFDSKELKEFLAKDLPHHMIPDHFVEMENIPLTPSGKIDRKALPGPGTGAAASYSPPRNEIQWQLVNIWSDVLAIEKSKISIDADFFHLGGHSLKATILAAKVHKILDVKLPLEEIFKSSTIRKLSQSLEGVLEDKYAAIEPVEERDYYEVSPAQKRLFLLQEMDRNSVVYNELTAVSLEGRLEVERLEHTFRQLIRRHESLRTSFEMKKDDPIQRIHDEIEFEMEYYCAESKAHSAERKEERCAPGAVRCASPIKDFIRPFDLSHVPLFRVGIIKTDEKNHILMLDMHHIITDGTSMQVFIREFMVLYWGRQLPGLRIQYKDFSQWQNRLFCTGVKEKQETYWLKQFKGDIPVLDLPGDYSRPVLQSFEGSRLRFEMGKDQTAALNTFAIKENVTLYMLLMALFNVLLARLSGQEDIVVGSPIAGRRHPDLQHIMGMFVNTLAVRNTPAPGKSFRVFLSEVKNQTLQAFENQEYPFEDLVEKVVKTRDMSRNPIFSTVFGLQNMDIEAQPQVEEESPEVQLIVKPYPVTHNVSKFDLLLLGNEAGEKLLFVLEYCTKLFKKETLQRYITYFKTIVTAVLENPDQAIGEIEFLSGAEKQRLLFEFNDTAAYYPGNKTIRQLFEEQMEKTPDNSAVVGPWQMKYRTYMTYISYRQLNEKSNQLAQQLIEKGVKPDTIVAIMVERSSEMIIGILGILKAGGAYLPIDPDSPRERLDFMLKDSSATILLTRKEIAGLSSPQALNNRPKGASSHLHPSPAPVTSLAYIIYTSGTTGKPKGSLIEQRNVVRLLFNDQFQFDFNNTDVWTLFHSFCFDFSVWEMYGALLYGGKLVIIHTQVTRDPGTYLKVLKDQQVTVLNQTPSAFYNLIEEELKSPGNQLYLRYVIFGGEALKPGKLKEWRSKYPGTRLINMYGITETTVHVTFKEIGDREIDWNISNIGQPIPTLSTYIVNKYLMLQPIGVAGELLVAGKGVGRGYLNQPELTANKFLFYRSYRSYMSYISKKIYKSGDLVRWLGSGDIEYLGRIDHQVKIRGFRIESGEIETQLQNHPSIKESIVIARDDEEEKKYLCAYIVGSDSTFDLSELELREYLSHQLPDYMIPSYFIPLEKIPLTPNGKVDRQALPEPGSGEIGLDSGATYRAPRNAIEEKLVKTWEHVLGREHIGIEDNFFMRGGDSIRAIQLASRMNNQGYKIEIRDIFLYPSISELAPRVKKLEHMADQSVISGNVPLTPIQKRFFQEPKHFPHHYNQAVMFYSGVRLDKTAIEALFAHLHLHHDALRLTFRQNSPGGNVSQINNGMDYPLSLQEHDLKGQEDAANLLETRVNEIQAGINLETGPLMKLGLFHLDDGDRLLAAVHHLVIDGLSWRILFEDIETLYQQYKNGESFQLPLKTDSYKKWAEKLLEYADSEEFLKEKPYWAALEAMHPYIPVIKKDFQTRGNHNLIKHTDKQTFLLSEAETEQLLTKVNDAFGTEINDILLTALGLAVKKTYGHEQVLIGLEGHGREEILPGLDVSRTVGWFTTIYPVVLDMSHEDRLVHRIKKVKESLRQVPHKGIGYGILRYLTSGAYKQEIGFHLNPQIFFNYMGQFDAEVGEMSFQVAKESPGNTRSPEEQNECDYSFSGMIANNRLVMSVNYNRFFYKQETIETLMNHYQEELRTIISFCAKREKRERTPADFTYKKLSFDLLDAINVRLGEDSIEDIYPLSPMQEGMLFHWQLEKELPGTPGAVYFEQMSYRLQGELDIPLVEKSLNQLFNRHEILRMLFIYENPDQPVQVVLKERYIDFYYEDIRHLVTPGENEGYIKEFKEKDKQRAFDLSKDVLMRVSVLQLADSQYEFIWSFHHILMDGWCIGILNAEFFEIYNAYLQKRAFLLPPVKSYRTYIQWLQKQDKEVSKIFWSGYLEAYKEVAEIPRVSVVKKEVMGYKHELFSFQLEKEKTNGLNALAGRNQVTLNSIMQTVWGVILGKYNRKEDVAFGAVVSGRPSEIEGVEYMVGLFINTIPVRIRCEQKRTFKDLLAEIQENAVNSQSHHHYPLVEIQAASPLKQNLLNHIFIFENYPIAQQIQKENQPYDKNQKSMVTLKLDHVDVFEQTNYDFNLGLMPGKQIKINFNYNANVYEPEFIQRIAYHIERVVEQILDNEKVIIGDIILLTEEEKRHILYELNDTDAGYPWQKTIYQLFEEQVQRTPDYIVLIGPRTLHKEGTRGFDPLCAFISLTYSQLNQSANQLAQLLRAEGVEADAIVGMMMERSIEMIIGIMGILKAGGAYLPIDPGYPEERIQYILIDSNAKFLVTTPALSERFEKLLIVNCQLLIVNEIPPNRRRLNNPPKESSSINNLQLKRANLAYIIYTSGTTGKPKGVMIRHGSLVNRLNWMQRNYPIGPGDIILQKTPITFDVSVWELFWWSLAGAGVCLLGPGDEKSPQAIIEAVEKHNVTTMHFVPSMLNAFLDYMEVSGEDHNLSGLTQVFASGEALGVHQVQRFNQLLYSKDGTHLANLYGPTEATVDVSYFNCSPDHDFEKIPIGKPIDNIRLYIADRVDKGLRLQPVGVPGELCIGGVGLARGYLNRPDLTAEKFDHDFWDYQDKRKKITGSNDYRSYRSYKSYTYRTGDLARWLLDGNIEFLGRMDFQVKIRGFRIELGEIQSQLLKHDWIKQAVVVAGEDSGGDSYLCAYIVPVDEKTVENAPIFQQELNTYLSRWLPDYMVPTYMMPIETIPLTPNGKLDWKALPAPGITTGTVYIVPRNAIEEKLVTIWSQVLGSGSLNEPGKISIDDNFFRLGGHSLKAALLTARIHKELKVKVPLAVVFKNSTIRKLAQYIGQAVEDQFHAIEPVEKKEYYPLSSAQKRMYIIHRMAPASILYNMPVAVVLESSTGSMDKDKFEGIFRKLIHRHESLRTSFHMINEEPVQRVHLLEDVEFEIRYYDLQETGAGDRCRWKEELCMESAAALISSFIRPFELSRAPMLRVGIIKEEENKYILIVDLHHIISDGVSMGLLIKEFTALYAGEELPALQVRYKDYSQWQQGEKEKQKIKQQGVFWKKIFEEEIPVLDLPTDYPRPKFQQFAGSRQGFEIGLPETLALKEAAARQQVTLFMLLLCLYNVLFSKLSGQEDIIVGTPAAGRGHSDLQQVIGMFVNTLALRNYPASNKTFREFLQEVKENMIAAFENQEYPFEDLVEETVVKKDVSRNPLFDVMFTFQDMDIPGTDHPGLKLRPYDYENPLAKFDLTLTAMEGDDTLFFTVEYCTKLFKKGTIHRFVNYFRKIVSVIIEDVEKKISGIEIISEDEKRQILEVFNNTTAHYPENKTIHRLFEEQVERTPDDTALVGGNSKFQIPNSKHRVPFGQINAFGAGHLTYKDLNNRAGGLAHLLIERGVQPDMIVGIMVERSIEMIIGIFGILKAGGAYLPIDLDYPEERINYVLSDSSAKIVLTSDAINRVPTTPHLHLSPAPATSLAYILYTSGSTGKPKGVMVGHAAITNFVYSFYRHFHGDFGTGDHCLAITNITFDVSVCEIFVPLVFGGTLSVLPLEMVLDAKQLAKVLVEQSISFAYIHPHLLAGVCTSLKSCGTGVTLNKMLVGVEPIKDNVLENFLSVNPGMRIINGYGPTEATICATFYPYQSREPRGVNVPIGKPLPNTKVLVVDTANHLVPIGVPGEACIAGAGLAHGYLNNPELTNQKFKTTHQLHEINNQKLLRGVQGGGFLEKSPPGRRRPNLYKTGDLVHWLPDGNIKFLGRKDHQVKVRGFRIELGEIENQLLTHKEVKDAVVLAWGDKETYICAYFVSEKELTSSGLREFLSHCLPGYMVPSYFVPLEKIPITVNGKIDRKSLPHPREYRQETRKDYVEPKNRLERKIAETWKEVLDLDQVGIGDDFFELGGNSLKVVQLKEKLDAALAIDIPVVVLFERTTIRSLVHYLTREQQMEPAEDYRAKFDRKATLNRAKNTRQKHRDKRRIRG